MSVHWTMINSPGAAPSKKTHSPCPSHHLSSPKQTQEIANCGAYLTHQSSNWPPDSSSEHLLQGPGLGPSQDISPTPFPKLLQPLNFDSSPPQLLFAMQTCHFSPVFFSSCPQPFLGLLAIYLTSLFSSSLAPPLLMALFCLDFSRCFWI